MISIFSSFSGAIPPDPLVPPSPPAPTTKFHSAYATAEAQTLGLIQYAKLYYGIVNDYYSLNFDDLSCVVWGLTWSNTGDFTSADLLPPKYTLACAAYAGIPPAACDVACRAPCPRRHYTPLRRQTDGHWLFLLICVKTTQKSSVTKHTSTRHAVIYNKYNPNWELLKVEISGFVYKLNEFRIQ